MTATSLQREAICAAGSPQRPAPRVLLSCPDARQPAYEAAVGLQHAGQLAVFVTSFYDHPEGWHRLVLGHLPQTRRHAIETRLKRRSHPGLDACHVESHAHVDFMAALENRAPQPALRRFLVRARTRWFDCTTAAALSRHRPDLAFLFADVGSHKTLDRCRALGIPAIVSVVHGEVEEENQILAREQMHAQDFFEIYLGDGRLDRAELDWLHARRRRDARLASLLLVPSEHIAARYRQAGVSSERIQVVPYAADPERFQPRRHHAHKSNTCKFVFAGGITQRKGIKYLLEAWSQVRREGWTLNLVGALPNRLGPLSKHLDQPGVEWAGAVSHAEMPERLARGDVFVFPSLFEGSAVVTYEALATGLPLVVTAEAGSVARDGVEGLIVPASDATSLARALVRLGEDPDLRARMGQAARARALDYTWSHYHANILSAIESVASWQRYGYRRGLA